MLGRMYQEIISFIKNSKSENNACNGAANGAAPASKESEKVKKRRKNEIKRSGVRVRAVPKFTH